MSAPFYAVFGLFIALAAIVLVRRAYVFYRDNKPNQYRVHRSRWDDSRPVDSRDLMAAHWRIVGRK